MWNNVRRHESGRPVRVLVADDAPAKAEMIAKIYRDRGCQVAVACNGLDALKLAKNLVPELAVLSYDMPKLNGIEVLRHVRKNPRTRGVNVIINSPVQKAALLAQRAGAQGFIQCPLSPEAIHETADRLLM